MTTILNYIKELLMIILSISFIELMLPDTSMKKYVKFIFSIVVMAVILDPLKYFLHKF